MRLGRIVLLSVFCLGVGLFVSEGSKYAADHRTEFPIVKSTQFGEPITVAQLNGYPAMMIQVYEPSVKVVSVYHADDLVTSPEREIVPRCNSPTS